ncbi:phosphoribosylanthranilate isomerase [Rhodomicrobium sp. Az07]|uniref:phosphoribosylanthranilate isomerase n=1 Tax=Rhodomicrobium sp. Az07 TaxID=2839034 RepID=UPI001BE91D16|nr:phosphoribosylanthranilate isomerase [Rhodomicrobium sp. Az07]MBT3071071.1 phosphoribosylanthranilate isomerase [Rhodomicrobium sp. Az07]
MTVSVKICGLSTEDTLEAAIGAGADYAGLVFFPKSPRNVSLDRAAELATLARGRIAIVALTVDADDALLEAIKTRVAPDFFQLHGRESAERVADIRRRFGARIIKAVKVGSLADIEASRAFEAAADIVLFDAPPPGAPDALPGGNGVSFDWRWLAKAQPRPDFMLSGGLDPDNVRLAIATSGTASVDVSSGVERSPGVKDPDLIARFVRAAKLEPVAARAAEEDRHGPHR